mmetsp:Transcript_39084/g.116997  ORF Transcript_39084/g.116997 Transcript_39084/m.116997 type:complete len:294 (-) Transcript_39084:58-939(-)
MLRLALALAALPHASAFALPAHTHSSSPVALAPAARSCVVRVGRALMGRAEKRMAKKRSRKGPQYQGGRPLRAPSGAKSNDVVPRSVVLGRLKEVPVFGLMSAAGGLVQQDGEVTYYLSPREAEKARAAVAGGARLVAKTLDEVYFDQTARLKPADSALREAKTIPQERALVQRCSTPLFCIDGMQTTATESGATSLPIFFSKAELLDFATPVYGARAEDQVLLTDLPVVVSNMVQGPAGLLRDARFFPEAKAVEEAARQGASERQDLFGTAGTLEAEREREGRFGGMKLPWM